MLAFILLLDLYLAGAQDCQTAEDAVVALQLSSHMEDTRRRGECFDPVKLWAGSDDAGKEIATLLQMSTDDELAAIHAASDEKLWLQIAGMFDAGTNLLGATLEENLGSDVFKSLCPGVDMTNQLTTSQMHDGYHCRFWKHTDPAAIDGLLKQATEDGVRVVMLAMVRSPVAQISSWERNPYDLNCVHVETLYHDERRTCSARGGNYSGLTAVWNHYTRGYAELAEKYPEHEIKLIEYERLVIEPEAVFAEISEALDRGEPDDFKTIRKSAKSHWGIAPSGREAALKRIRDMTYLKMSDLTRIPGNCHNGAGKTCAEALVKRVCGKLDPDIMRNHVLTVNGAQRSYEADCIGTNRSFDTALTQKMDAPFADSS
eukprot:TRINITY_DN98668_c0_g1_i1.p1 TRINITY_DN98668_c0_g1~~TRINITY_DN98668_c0_g1_i1.p1  ORF type:complete len:373 (-),score=69.84 TRINITY_DN98668_c0_g1_i1:29-1147(-)